MVYIVLVCYYPQEKCYKTSSYSLELILDFCLCPLKICWCHFFKNLPWPFLFCFYCTLIVFKSIGIHSSVFCVRQLVSDPSYYLKLRGKNLWNTRFVLLQYNHYVLDLCNCFVFRLQPARSRSVQSRVSRCTSGFFWPRNWLHPNSGGSCKRCQNHRKTRDSRQKHEGERPCLLLGLW